MKIQSKNNPYEKEVLIIKSHVKNWIKGREMRCQDKTFRAINDALIELLEKAVIRTKLSGRKTLSPQHI